MRALGPDDPRTVGTYRILRVLGAGGMGRVYVGRSRTGRIVAVKVILPGLADDPGFRDRFRREVASARRVGGSWTAPVLDADTEAEQPWLVTGYVPGLSLGEAVAERGPLPSASLRALAAGLAEALTAVHDKGVVHRDLKPSNVMLSPDGPRVIDFGISRAVDASVLTSTGLTVGSPGFMAPEQIEGADIGPAADVFALGAVLTFAATGNGPFGEGNSQALIFRILAQEPRLEAVPDEFRPIVAACLAKNPAQRPAPSDVLRTVAPDGDADALITTGWLPPDLANAVSRRAVALLELEDEPVGEQLPPTPFGPGYGFGRDAPPFGSPPSYLTAADAPPYVLPTQPAAPPPALPSDRQRSALPYVAAIVVAGIAVLIAVLLTRGNDGDDNGNVGASGTPTTGSTTTGTGTNPTTSPLPNATGAGALPDSYVGTWTGTGTTADGLVSQQITITLRPGDTGSVVGDMKASTLGLECTGDSRLVGIAPDGLLLEDVPGSGSTGNFYCTSGGRYTLQRQQDGTLLFTSHADGAGGLSGPLSKAP